MSGLVPAGPSCRTRNSSDTEDKPKINNKHNGTKNTTEVANKGRANGGIKPKTTHGKPGEQTVSGKAGTKSNPWENKTKSLVM